MKVRLIRAARILHMAGEIVEVSPAEAGFLLSTRSAEIVPEVKETPEEMLTAEEVPEEKAQEKETPEKGTAKKTTRAKK